MVNMKALLIGAYLIAQWIFLSSSLILFNKHLISGGFNHPITLVLLHMAFGSVAATVWRGLGLETVPPIGLRTWMTGFLPVGVCFAGSLALSNMAYAYISVAYIQMIKALTPVLVLLISFCFGIETPSLRLFGYIVLISSGVITACVAQVETSISGTLMQLAAIMLEALRLCLINVLLTSKGVKLSAIANLFYIAPTSFVCLLGPWALVEAPFVLSNGAAALRAAGGLTLLANSSIAFLLNLATLALIKHTSALTLNVAGVVKDLLLIAWSVIFHAAAVSMVQYGGYAVAFCGVTGYTAYKRRVQAEEAALKAENERRSLLAAELDTGDDLEED